MTAQKLMEHARTLMFRRTCRMPPDSAVRIMVESIERELWRDFQVLESTEAKEAEIADKQAAMDAREQERILRADQ